ncbi:flavin reductase family protein [Streptomyces sp. M10(2022)]
MSPSSQVPTGRASRSDSPASRSPRSPGAAPRPLLRGPQGRAWPEIRESGRFCVNVLAAEQTELCGRFGSSKGLKYDGLDWEVSRWGTPSLPGVLTRVHAQVYDVRSAGDHDVVIGRVLGLEPLTDGRPMLFFRGGFGVEERTGGPAAPAAPVPWGWGDHWG